jgi:hypothetical protein
VQLRHWRRAGLLDGLRLTPSRLATVRDWQANARAAHAFLAARGALDERDPIRLTRLYTGWDRPRFAARLEAAWSALAADADASGRPPLRL